MKRTRKGFTLVELLIVIGVIGVLASMMMVSNSEATDSAKSIKIIEGFQSITAAMMTYYAENMTVCDTGVVAADIKTGIQDFLKDGGDSIVTDSATIGKYLITVYDDNSWWLTYKLSENDNTRIGLRLKNRAKDLGLKKEPAEAASVADYAGAGEISIKVRS